MKINYTEEHKLDINNYQKWGKSPCSLICECNFIIQHNHQFLDSAWLNDCRILY